MSKEFNVEPLKGIWYTLNRSIFIPHEFYLGEKNRFYVYKPQSRYKTKIRARSEENEPYIEPSFDYTKTLEFLAATRFFIDRMTLQEWTCEFKGKHISKWYIDELDITLINYDKLFDKNKNGGKAK